MAARRKRWNRERGVEVVTALERSGLSIAEFARRQGYNPERVRRWRARLRATDRAQQSPAELRMVELVAARPSPRLVTVCVTCPSGHVVELASVPLRDVFEALAEVTSC